jgi:hypothetical protein
MAKTTALEPAVTETPLKVSDDYSPLSRLFAGVAQSCGGEIDPAAVVVESE